MATAVFVGFDTDLTDADQNVDALLSGWLWDLSATGILTYSFPDGAEDIGYPLEGGAFFSSQLSAEQQDAVRLALAQVAGVSGLEFEELGDDAGEDNAAGTLRFFEMAGADYAYSHALDEGEAAGDSVFAEGQFETPALGSYEFHTILHEIGLSLGLKKAHIADGSGAMSADMDSSANTVMTYRSYEGHDLDTLPFYTQAQGHYAQSLMAYDIAALQEMYGADFTHNAGRTIYRFDPDTGEMLINGESAGVPMQNIVFRTIWDGDGQDTYDFRDYTTRLDIDLAPGAYSDLDVSGTAQRAELNFGIGHDIWISYNDQYEVYADGHLYNALQYQGDVRSLIEHAIGGSNADRITGNAADNFLQGMDGNDTISGLEGNDRLFGGGGHDVLQGNQGNDLLRGGAGNDTLYGRQDNDRLRGEGGDDILVGGRGSDMLEGGEGADRFIFYVGTDIDRVVDFEIGVDLLDLRYQGITSLEEVMASAWDTPQGHAKLVFDNGDVVVLENILLSELSISDFLFA